jgi:hypothetical protein
MRCNICGKFAKIVDSYTPFGYSEDSEPPDNVYMCQKCVDEDIVFWKKIGCMPSHWYKAQYEEQLAKELGYVWVVESGNAWGTWMKDVVYAPWSKKQVDKLKEWQNNDLFHPYTCWCGEDLIPKESGWVCKKCDHTQNWCHGFSCE